MIWTLAILLSVVPMVGCSNPQPETKTPGHGPWVNERVGGGEVKPAKSGETMTIELRPSPTDSALDTATKALVSTTKTLNHVYEQQERIKKTLDATHFVIPRLTGISNRGMEVCKIFIDRNVDPSTTPADQLAEKLRTSTLCGEMYDLQVEIDVYISTHKF